MAGVGHTGNADLQLDEARVTCGLAPQAPSALRLWAVAGEVSAARSSVAGKWDLTVTSNKRENETVLAAA